MPNPIEWKLLARLFADEHASYHHRLSLSRIGAPEFYAPTTEAAPIREQKQAILASAAADEYFFDCDEGLTAFLEFARKVSLPANATDPTLSRGSLNRAATLALEPDWMLLATPDWRLLWASVCFPTRWSLAGKGSRPLAEIHGIVPGLNAELGRKIDVFFGKLAPGDGWARANWGLSTSAERNQHPSRPYTALTDQTPMGNVFVRVESQHLLKLPESGAIAFGIRILNFPLAEVAECGQIVAGLKEQLRTMPGAVAAYKGIPEKFWERI